MQRAAASTAQAQAVPDSDLAFTNKRQKTDLWVVKAAVDQEQAKIEEALERHAVVPETKWVLSTPSVMPQVGSWHAGHLRVHETGYAEIENDVGPYRHSEIGRRSFGKFNRELEVSLGSSTVPYYGNPLLKCLGAVERNLLIVLPEAPKIGTWPLLILIVRRRTWSVERRGQG